MHFALAIDNLHNKALTQVHNKLIAWDDAPNTSGDLGVLVLDMPARNDENDDDPDENRNGDTTFPPSTARTSVPAEMLAHVDGDYGPSQFWLSIRRLPIQKYDRDEVNADSVIDFLLEVAGIM